ncbi:MAG: acyl-ACP--UDP-N-acetylglucosamine O-acyltransferase [Verrucomicrobiae bacterium]|nr:acyl-ACP--UDP-N-acetylglucosamine O-acyltransferase [Verrucomicrobiae bacterium]
MIHPTAVVHREAELDPTVKVGPYVIIDAHVKVGARCVIGPYVHLTGHTEIGSDNIFHAGCVIGDAPQDLKYKGQPTRLRIGDHNVFREHATVHRSNHPEEDTVIGSYNFLMAHSHVGHNARVGDNVILANGALLAGHTLVQDGAIISGNCLVHQFTRVGALALMQGGAAVSKDVPPCTIAWGQNSICGLNVIGLRRAGVSPEERLELKRLYHAVFRSGTAVRKAVASAKMVYTGHWARLILEFIEESRRGVCTHARNESSGAS